MSIPRLVYVVNAKTNEVDTWTCTGEIRANYRGNKEVLCVLYKGRKSALLPKRCVFDSEEVAREVLNHK